MIGSGGGDGGLAEAHREGGGEDAQDRGQAGGEEEGAAGPH